MKHLSVRVDPCVDPLAAMMARQPSTKHVSVRVDPCVDPRLPILFAPPGCTSPLTLSVAEGAYGKASRGSPSSVSSRTAKEPPTPGIPEWAVCTVDKR